MLHEVLKWPAIPLDPELCSTAYNALSFGAATPALGKWCSGSERQCDPHWWHLAPAPGRDHPRSHAQVLSIFPTPIRRRIMRYLYLKHLRDSYLFKGCPSRWVVATRLVMHAPLRLSTGLNAGAAGLPVQQTNAS